MKQSDKTPESPKPIIIQLQPEWFEQGYYVYLVNIRYNKKQYNYIGMTGDRRATTARSPFFRMSGHFNLQDASLENQVTKGLRSAINPNKDYHAELTKMDIKYYLYKVRDFDKKKHNEKRVSAERIESWLIRKFKEDKRPLFNDKISNTPTDKTGLEANPIYLDMIKRIF